jgi:8-oxo-dGTP diphosphatase
MDLPYRIAVLCYLYDEDGHVLLLHRRKDPNAGMMSPIGGKVETARGESPHGCAVREIAEEAGLRVTDDEVRLAGIVAETAYERQTHWLIFLFEVVRPVDRGEIARLEIDEGVLEWVPVADVAGRPIPPTDRTILWPLVQAHRGGFFMVDIDCRTRPPTWSVRESRT